MIFSSKAEYGVRLMVELGRQSPEQPTSLKAIADAESLPLAYLEQVVARLRKAGLVMSASSTITPSACCARMNPTPAAVAPPSCCGLASRAESSARCKRPPWQSWSSSRSAANAAQ